MQARIPRALLAALAALISIAILAPQCAWADDQNVPPVYVTVEGEQLSYEDVIQLTAFMIGAVGIFNTAVIKPPGQMPKETPYAYYAGKDASGKPIVWLSSAVSGSKLQSAATNNTEVGREMESAAMLAILDGAQGTSTLHKVNAKLQRIYEKVKSDPARMASLGAEITAAMTQMSEKTVAYGKEQRHWIFANIHAGMTRAQVHAILRAHGLSASEVQGVTQVTFPGAFEPGCYFSNSVSITFDKTDRLYKIDLDQPHPDCL